MLRIGYWSISIALAACFGLGGATDAKEPGSGETVDEALCRLIETSAEARELPVGFLTRLIWRESSFRPNVVSRAGAQGIAQFMHGTARERGLADPFDPEAAIPAAAALLADLRRQFGNLGLAAAAYNARPARVRQWLAGRSGLPGETVSYVARVTGRKAREWAGDVLQAIPEPPPEQERCLPTLAHFRQLSLEEYVRPGPAPLPSPWHPGAYRSRATSLRRWRSRASSGSGRAMQSSWGTYGRWSSAPGSGVAEPARSIEFGCRRRAARRPTRSVTDCARPREAASCSKIDGRQTGGRAAAVRHEVTLLNVPFLFMARVPQSVDTAITAATIPGTCARLWPTRDRRGDCRSQN